MNANMNKEDTCKQALLNNIIKHDACSWLKGVCENSLESAKKLELPTLKTDGWRFTDLAPLLQYEFHPVSNIVKPDLAGFHSIQSGVDLTDIEKYLLPDTIRLVFINGQYSERLSDLTLANNTVNISNLCDEAKHKPNSANKKMLQESFSEELIKHNDVFSLLNASFFADAALINITSSPDEKIDSGEDNTTYSNPVIHLLHVAVASEVPQVNYPHCLLRMEANSRATLVEDYISLKGTEEVSSVCFSNAATEIVLRENASLQHVMLQRNDKKDFHIGNCRVSCKQNSNYMATPILLGSRLSRYAINVALLGVNAQAHLDGLTLIDGRQVADIHSVIKHDVPDTKSVQLHKCLTDGASHAIFNGKIIVGKCSSGTDSTQQNRNLVLSDKSRVNTQPELEIYNDDVRCSHGATVSQIDHETLFFLKSRGISEIDAKNLFIHAFATEIINKICVSSLVKSLNASILEYK